MEAPDLSSLDFDPLNRQELIVLPDEPNEKFCELVNAYYANKGYNIYVRADSYLKPADMPSLSTFRRVHIPRSFKSYRGESTSHTIIGMFDGLEVRTDFRKSDEGEIKAATFALLSYPEDITAGESIKVRPDQQILVPLTEMSEIVLERF